MFSINITSIMVSALVKNARMTTLERQKKRHTVERIKDHNSEDNSSHLLQHARENGRAYV